MFKNKLRALKAALFTLALTVSVFALSSCAVGGTTEEGAGANSTSSWMSIGMLVLVVVFFYFFLIRPQKKQEKEAAQMRNSLEIGDEIVTIGGIVGQVISIKNDTITIITSKDRTKIRFLKSAIREVSVKANEPIEKPAASEGAPLLKEDKASAVKNDKSASEETDDKQN